MRQKEAGQPLSFLQRLRLLFKDRATSRASIGIFILCSVQNFGYYGLMIWMPTHGENFGFSSPSPACGRR